MRQLRLWIRQAQHINAGLVVNWRSSIWKNRIRWEKDRGGFFGAIESSAGFCQICHQRFLRRATKRYSNADLQCLECLGD